MPKIFFLWVFCLLLPCAAFAQAESNNNVVISAVNEQVNFEKGNPEAPVLIKYVCEITYTCRDFRTDIPFADFYNDKESIDNVEIYVNGKKRTKDISIHKEAYNADGIFYSDAKVMYMTLPIEAKGSNTKIIIQKTITDPRYLSQFFLCYPYPVLSHQLTLNIPDWVHAEPKEFNFAGYKIEKNVTMLNGVQSIRYAATDLPELNKDAAAPGITYTSPHVILLVKDALVNNNSITYFRTVADLYDWYAVLVDQIGNDDKQIHGKALEITKDSSSDMGKVKAIYHWVQENIRYLAFENGIAGFRPESAQDVLRKKYGDCKGMANLTKSLLSSLGFDARLCWLGTRHIAYDYSLPSMVVDNHMICRVTLQGKNYFLDATENNLAFGNYSERIQGRQALVEDGTKYILQNIPSATYAQNNTVEAKTVRVENNALVGAVSLSYDGESKEYLLDNIEAVKKDKMETAIKNFIADNKNDYRVSDMETRNLTSKEDAPAVIQYQFAYPGAVSSFGNEIYVDLDLNRSFADFKIDTSKRKADYLFPFKAHYLTTVTLEIPKGFKLQSLPPAFHVHHTLFDMDADYTEQVGKIIYRKEIKIKNTLLAQKYFAEWNAAVAGLNEFYNNQLTFIKP